MLGAWPPGAEASKSQPWKALILNVAIGMPPLQPSRALIGPCVKPFPAEPSWLAVFQLPQRQEPRVSVAGVAQDSKKNRAMSEHASDAGGAVAPRRTELRTRRAGKDSATK